jgi:hypothetical protein
MFGISLQSSKHIFVPSCNTCNYNKVCHLSLKIRIRWSRRDFQTVVGRLLVWSSLSLHANPLTLFLFNSFSVFNLISSACHSLCVFSCFQHGIPVYQLFCMLFFLYLLFLSIFFFLCLLSYLPQQAVFALSFILSSSGCHSSCFILVSWASPPIHFVTVCSLSYSACHSISFFLSSFFSPCTILSLSSYDRLSHTFCHPSIKAFHFSIIFPLPKYVSHH